MSSELYALELESVPFLFKIITEI